MRLRFFTSVWRQCQTTPADQEPTSMTPEPEKINQELPPVLEELVRAVHCPAPVAGHTHACYCYPPLFSPLYPLENWSVGPGLPDGNPDGEPVPGNACRGRGGHDGRRQGLRPHRSRGVRGPPV